MKYFCIKIFVILVLVLVYCGCPSISLKDEKEITRKPEIIIHIASLNLGNLNKRIEQKYIVELAKVLKREQVEVLAVQGISRYPGVATRVDFVDELSAKTDWQNAFGEMMNISGRQTGNAVFSSYPILSQHNQTFDHLKSLSFEAGLQATIDAGIRSLVVVSVQLPAKITIEEEAQCIQLIAASISDKSNLTTIITGNLSSSEVVHSSYSFTEVPQSGSARGTTPSIWYSANASFQLLASHTVETELGKLIIAQLGLFRQK
jgi:endonuclease/exonuclease/phosphatase family metal-dependent hydrolase